MKYKEWSMSSGSPRVRQNLEAAGIPALLAAILAVAAAQLISGVLA